jgi:hypothetical protein
MPYRAAGREYVCALDGGTIPDGATVLASYDDADKLIGVRAEDADGQVLHRCGKPLPGHDMSPAERVEARSDDAYAAETGV